VVAPGSTWCAAASPRRAPASLRGGLTRAQATSGALGDGAGAAPSSGRRPAALAALLAAAVLGGGGVARALVKGNAPPKNYGVGKNFTEAADCKSVGDCQELGRTRETEEFGAAGTAKDVAYQKTASGARYKDMTVGSGDVVKKDSVVQVRYRVMRSGKRSSDGLSGEASTIFSLGYGEDDGPKDATLTVPLGQGRFVKAVEEGLIGMSVGGVRRVQVRPENGLGWKKEGKCATEVQSVGLIAGLPVGGAEQQEDCLDSARLPQPQDFASKRRFSRRFDESLIVEAELVALGAK